jgi:propionyl-CoA synthetase
VLIVDRGLDSAMPAPRDAISITRREVAKHAARSVPCEWLESSEPSYILYTSGTTGKPKGVQRDTGGYAVALAASMRDIFCVAPGETMFTTSDIGWVVGTRTSSTRRSSTARPRSCTRAADPSRSVDLVEDRVAAR